MKSTELPSSSPLSTPGATPPTTPGASPSSPAARADVAPASPELDPRPYSRFIRSPTPQRLKPRLEDFSYCSTPFPAHPPPITPSSSPLDLTISLISQILESTDNDVALTYLADHLVVQRLFTPRRVPNGVESDEANFALRRQYSASAMAWYILDPGTDEGTCAACQNDQSQGPFKECLVPTEPRAEGACTNCFFMGRSALCPHRVARTEAASRKRPRTFEGLRDDDVHAATERDLRDWATWLRSELILRSEMKAPPTSRRRKRRLDG